MAIRRPMGRWSIVGSLLVAFALTCSPVLPNTFGDDFDAAPCLDDAGPLPPHVARFDPPTYGCDWSLVCDDGWFDCDQSVAGCESTTDCLAFPLDASVPFAFPWPLQYAAHGVAVCGDAIVFIDGRRVISGRVGEVPVTLATLASDPSGGVVCDDAFAYLPLQSTFKAPLNGRVVRVPLVGGAPVDLAAQVDPAPSIDRDTSGNVYWIARKPMGTVVVMSNTDASIDLLPVSEPQVYKTIALHQGLWAIDNGEVRHLLADGGVDVIAAAGGVALAPRPSGMSVLYQVPGGFAFSLADGGNPWVGVNGLASYQEDLFLATNTGLYRVPLKGPPVMLAGGYVDELAVVANNAYYTQGSVLNRASW